MSRDDCMYDYLRPSDCWTANPWAYHVNEGSLILTICDQDTPGAEPLYDAIDGEICLYVEKRKHPAAVCEHLVKELEPLVIKSVQRFDDPKLQGSEDAPKTERLTAGRMVVQDGEIIGGFEDGKWYANPSDSIPRKWQHVFLPLNGEPRETVHTYKVAPHGSEGTEEEHLCRIFSTLERV